MQPGDLVMCGRAEILTKKSQSSYEEVGSSIPGEIYFFLDLIPPLRSHAEVIHPRLGIVRIYAAKLRLMDGK